MRIGRNPLHLFISVKEMDIAALPALPETFRFIEVQRIGIRSSHVKRWLEEGLIEKISRGVYRKTSARMDGLEDVVAVCKRVPRGVLCLESALYLHELGTQIPRQVTIAVERNAWVPKIAEPATRVVRLGGAAFSEGIERIESGGTALPVYGKAKTVADCFKFRNRIGEDVAVEALKALASQPGFTTGELLRYAKICRIDAVIRPYLVAVL